MPVPFSSRPPVPLEALVRPFAGPVVRPAANDRPIQDDTAVETPFLEWSARASVEVSTLGGGGVILDERPDDHDEVEREVEIERVFNPEDNSQYVDVERIKNITFRKKNGGQPTTFSYLGGP